MADSRGANKGMMRVIIECLDTMDKEPAGTTYLEARSEFIGMCKILHALDYGWTHSEVYDALMMMYSRFEQDNGKRPAQGSHLLRQWQNDCMSALLGALGRLD